MADKNGGHVTDDGGHVTELCKHWSNLRVKEKEVTEDMGKCDAYLQELGLLECVKLAAARASDTSLLRTAHQQQELIHTEYTRIVDLPNRINNYIDESLSLLEDAGDVIPSQTGATDDRTAWQCTLSLDDPELQQCILPDSSSWFSGAQLGYRQDNMPGTKRQRTSPPSLPAPSHSNTNTLHRDSTITSSSTMPFIDNYNRSIPPDNRNIPNSALPERLRSRVYPGSKNAHVQRPGAHSTQRHDALHDNKKSNPFESATLKYAKDCIKQNKPLDCNVKRSLGGKTAHPRSGPYAPPHRQAQEEEEEEEEEDERLRGVDKKLAKMIMSEIMDKGITTTWDDIAGLEFAKRTIKEIVVWPMLRPDIFTGLRGPPKGVLLFGPPGTGKTLIGRCIASHSKSTFFSISAASLTSKWIGQGEKMVRALFAVARMHQPAVIFIDEIDSLLSARSETEHESSRRIKTEFLVQLDGVACGGEERLLVVGATNRPQEIDEAARRRLVKRLYIPLPDEPARVEIVRRLVAQIEHVISEAGLQQIAERTEGYSGADMTSLCRDAALAPIRAVADIENINPSEVRALTVDDVISSTTRVRSSVDSQQLEQYRIWDMTFGSGV